MNLIKFVPAFRPNRLLLGIFKRPGVETMLGVGRKVRVVAQAGDAVGLEQHQTGRHFRCVTVDPKAIIDPDKDRRNARRRRQVEIVVDVVDHLIPLNRRCAVAGSLAKVESER